MLLPKFQVSNMESSRPDLIIPGFWTEIAGWPLLDEMIALLDYYPQVYVDTGAIDWLVPRKEFHAYLRRLVEAGDGLDANQVMQRLFICSIVWVQSAGTTYLTFSETLSFKKRS
jgi:hypothetical protein